MDWIERLNRVAGRVPLGSGQAAEVLQWAYQSYLPDNVPHRHTYFEVCLVGGWGEGRFIVEGTPHTLTPSTLFIARPGVVHQIVNAGTPLMELYWVSFLWEVGVNDDPLGRLLSRFADASHTLIAPDSDDRIGGIWRTLRLVAESTGSGVGQEAQLTALMAALLLGIAQAGSGPQEAIPDVTPTESSSALARIAVRYIHDNLSRPLTVPEVAGYLHISPRHLTRLFSHFTGVPPAAYIEQARMDRARSFLLRTDEPIKQVAVLVGYPDVHHFTRVFSRRFGCPPGRFRETEGAADTTPRGSNIQNPGALV